MSDTVQIEGAGKGPEAVSVEALDEFVGSAQVFAMAFQAVFEEAVLARIAGAAISLSQVRVLKLVAQSKAETVSGVAAFQGVSNAAASKSIDRLVRRDLLKRSEGEVDRRSSELALTRRGRRLLDLYEAARGCGLVEMFRGFPAAELQQTVDLLDRLTASVVSHSAHPETVCLQCHIYRREKCMVRESSREKCFYDERKRRKSGGRAKDET